MAVSTEQSVKQMTEMARAFAEHIQKSEKASKGIATNFDQLNRQLTSGHATMKDYLKAVLPLPKPFQDMSQALVRSREEIMMSIRFWEDRYRLETAAGKQTIALTKSKLDLQRAELEMKDSLHAITGKHLAVEFLLLKGFSEAIKRSGEVNESLIQANSLTRVRNDLTREIYEVQSQTGASLSNMLGAARALTAVWPKTRTDFKSTLEVVVQMEEGLGVSFENASQLARIFEINLKTPVREIADQIAIIANNTSLAADEATRFATEIGKALRLLGPGAAPGAKEVAGYVTMMAGRMKDVGGDANEIIKMFSEMTKGTSQAFMLRGMSGVNTPGALGNAGGAQAALQGIGKMIDRIVTAAPGTMAYTAQLETAAQIMGTSTETIRLYRDMLKEANKPLDEHAKLQQRWQEQVVNANKAIGRLKESFMALIHQALLPLIPPIAWFFGIIARFVSFLASSRAAVIAVTIVVGAAVAKTIASLYRLSAAIIQVAVSSEIASKLQLARRPLSIGGAAVEGGGLFAKLTQQLPWLSKIGGSMGGIMSVVSKIGRFAVSPPVLAALIGASVGIALGLAFNAMFPKWAKATGEAVYHAIYGKATYAQTIYKKPGERTVAEIMADVRKQALRGNIEEAIKIFEQGKYNVAGLQTERGARGYLEHFTKTMADVREKIGLSTVTVNEEKTLENDRRMIELTKQQVDNSGEYIKRVRDYEDRMAARQDAARAAAEKERMLKEAEFRMGGTRGPQKSLLTAPGHFLP